jgi:hypothetical protein
VRADEAESRLREMLTAAGVTPDGVEQHAPRTAWETFKAFATEAIDEAAEDPDRDMLNYYYGVADLEDGQCFSLILHRQLEFHDSGGEYDHMEYVECGLWCDLTPELEQVGFYEDGFTPAPTHLEMWLSSIEQSAGFAALMDAPACRVGVQQGRI